MQQWDQGTGDPLSLTLACDGRTGEPPSYTDDQIWELSLGGGEPPALALHTNYGLRAKSIRIFPSFSEYKLSLIDPQEFHQAPKVHQFYPNYLSISYAPFPGIDVTTDYWVPSSQCVAGRIKLQNLSIVPRQFDLDLIALLNPLEKGICMSASLMGVTPVLCGKTANLSPVLFITGGPAVGASPYPSLKISVDLLPEASRQLSWCLASLSTFEASFNLARQTTARRWDAEIARIQQVNSAGQLGIITGEPDWNAAIAFSQKTAFSLFTGRGSGLPNPSIVQARQPEHGFSPLADGSDYPSQWSGQTVFDVYYLLGYLLPGAVDLAEGLFRNFLATQSPDGTVDWKPGIGGQRGKLQAQPLLVNLAWKIFRANNDRRFLEGVYPKLCRYLDAWFNSEHDRDQDGIPEWDHPYQSGMEDHPLFDRWSDDGKGMDISTVEDPALASFLYQECALLNRMGMILDDSGMGDRLLNRMDTLRAFIQSCWDPRKAGYRLRDRDHHAYPRRRKLGHRKGFGAVDINQAFPTPSRLTIHVQSGSESSRLPHVRVIGKKDKEKIEEQVANRGLVWIRQRMTLTSQQVFTAVERVEIENISANDRVEVEIADLHPDTLFSLFPLWAHIPTAQQAQKILEKCITDPLKYGRQYGVPLCPDAETRIEAKSHFAVHPIWNTIIGEGLLSYGYAEQSAQLVAKMMDAVIQSLKQNSGYFQAYHSETGEGIGDPDDLPGLAPLSLLMQTLGVEIISATQIILHGNNPFPWPITVKYRGLSLVRREQDTWIIFPDGQTQRVPGSGNTMISLS